MLSQVAKRTVQSSVRSLSTARVLLTETPSGQGRSPFNDREKAEETVYIKKHEAEQLKALREKLEKQKEAISELESEINKLKK